MTQWKDAMARKRSAAPVLVGMSLILAACSGEPSESSMREAVEKTAKAQIDRARASMQALMGRHNPYANQMMPEFTGLGDFKKLSCVAATHAPGHVCDFRFTAKEGRTAQNAKGRFFKGADGFEFEEKT